MNPDPASLANLRDLALPPPVAGWPPTIGWWILAAGLVAALVLLTRKLTRRRKRNAYRRAAIAELRVLPDGAVAELATLLKRAALAAYPRARVARLSGASWLGFLDATGGGGVFSGGLGEKLARATLDPRVAPSPAEWAAMVGVARRWIRRHRGESASQ